MGRLLYIVVIIAIVLSLFACKDSLLNIYRNAVDKAEHSAS